MHRFHRWSTKVVIASMTGVLTVGSLSVLAGGSQIASANPPRVEVKAAAGQIGPGTIVHAASSSVPTRPTADQRAAQNAASQLLQSLPTAPIGPHTTQADVQTFDPGPETTLTQAQVTPNDFKVFKDTKIPSVCAVNCGQSQINEPSTANAGRVIVQTSNWNIAYTLNGGAASPTWLYQDPYALFGQFCCDQEVVYEPSRDRFIHTALTLGTGTQVGFTVSTAKSTAPTAWCTYYFNSSNFGGTAGELLDYPKISYSNNYTYVTWNRYDAAGNSWLGTGMARLSSDAMSSCAGFGYLYINQTNNFTFGLTRGGTSLDTFYWVSNWYTSTGGSGSSMRIYSWPENSGSVSFADRAINAYNFAGGSCASQDRAVTDWCSRLDPRWESPWISNADYRGQANSAFAGDDILGVAITAGPSGFTSFPYVVYEYFKLHSLTYIGNDQTYNPGFAFAYPGCTTNVHGYVGCAMSWGGGTGTTHYFPGGLLLLQDNVTPTQPWDYRFALYGSGNANGWGDYDVTLPFEPAAGPFISTIWAVNGSGAVEPHVMIFGRNHDLGGYARWKAK